MTHLFQVVIISDRQSLSETLYEVYKKIFSIEILGFVMRII